MIVDTIVANKAWIGLSAFALLFAAERLAPAAPAPADRARLARNGLLWACLLVLSPAIVLPLTAFAAEHPLWRRPAEPGWLMLIGDFVLLDFWAYWLHRAYHEIPPMKRLHIVHHLDRRLDSTSAVRFHPGEVALSALLRMIPITLLAMPFVHVVLFETALLIASLFHHSNIRLPGRLERALSRLIVTPSIHWVHHHQDPADTNSNYAAIFSLWDPIFRTRSRTRRTPDMEIGVRGLPDLPPLRLLAAPFGR
jgi:sterol desaturase/sphingolipid hydroxylase (fatty acid hydroxylase superfamily)